MARQEVAEVTASKNRWILETFLFPEIGSLPVASITSRVLLDALRKVEATEKLETAKRAKVKAGRCSGTRYWKGSRTAIRRLHSEAR
jgi:integrase